MLGDVWGIYGNKIEFSSKTFSSICESKENLKLGYEKIIVPSDLVKLLWSETNIVINKEIPDGKVLMKSHSKFTAPWYKDLKATVF